MKMELHDADYWTSRPIDSEKDWIDDAPNWIESYIQSVSHPHRKLILDEIAKLDTDKILEVGCNTGANLMCIRKEFQYKRLVGIDVNERCVEKARELLPGMLIVGGDYHNIPFRDKYVDLILCDAVLMYSGPAMIERAMKEIDRVTSRYIIIVDRWNRSESGVQNGHVWARNYSLILKKMGYKVTKKKIRPEDWPGSVGWAKYGVIIVAEKWLQKKKL